MRPLEALLSLANLLALVVLACPLPRAVFWLHYAVPLVLLLAALQVLVEGPRWQMLPAYALAGLLCAVWLQTLATGVARAQFLPPWLAIGVGVLGLVVSVGLPVILPVFGFPTPSGPYPIGSLTYHWVDRQRREVFSRDPEARRELMAQIWYPAKQAQAASREPYVQHGQDLFQALARMKHLPAFFLGHFKYVATHAIPAGQMADDLPAYPVLIFLEGAYGYRQMNTFQVEDLVSHGYIVVAIDQPYSAASVVFPDGHQVSGLALDKLKSLIHQSYSRDAKAPVLNGLTFEKGIIPYLAQDLSLTLNQLSALNQADPNAILTGRLDLHQVGTFGVSLGGIVASEACRVEPRLRACLIMDAPIPTEVVEAGLQQPALWITRDAKTMRLERRRSGGWPEAEIRDHQITMRATFEHMQGDAYYVQVDGLFHLNLTDIPLWSPLLSRLGVTGPIDSQRAHRIINAYTLAFFDRYLKAGPAMLLDGPAKQYPEVRFEARPAKPLPTL